MNYNEIIEPYLIDFDKLEVGQTLWSVQFGEIQIIRKWESKFTFLLFPEVEFDVSNNGFTLRTYFTSDPFANLQRVEPKLEKCTYCEHYGNLPCDKCEFGRSKIKTT